MTPSSSRLSTNAARSVFISTLFYVKECAAVTDISIKETSLDTTVNDIKNSQDGLPPLRNPPLLETVDDLATLSHLNEPSGMLTISSTFYIRY